MVTIEENNNVTSTMEDRIHEIMESEKLTQSEFSQKIKISSGSLSNIFNGRTKATNNHTRAIHEAFPNLNVNWLLFGEGEMYDRNPINVNVDKTVDESGKKKNGDSQVGVNQNEPLLNLFSMDNGNSSMNTPIPINYSNEINSESIKNLYIRQRNIKEIRVFYDDGTYESFIKQ